MIASAMDADYYFERLAHHNHNYISDEEEDEDNSEEGKDEDDGIEAALMEQMVINDGENAEDAVLRRKEKRRQDLRTQRKEQRTLLRQQNGRWFVEAVDLEGRTALHHAALYGHEQCVAMLLSFGAADAAVEAHTEGEGMTALMLTCKYGYYKCAEVLVEGYRTRFATNASNINSNHSFASSFSRSGTVDRGFFEFERYNYLVGVQLHVRSVDVHGDPIFTQATSKVRVAARGAQNFPRSPQKRESSKSRTSLRLPESPQKKANEMAIASAARRAHAYTYVTAGSQRKAEKEAASLQLIAARTAKAARDKGEDPDAAVDDESASRSGYTPLLSYRCTYNAADLAYNNGHMRIHRMLIGPTEQMWSSAAAGDAEVSRIAKLVMARCFCSL
jgi:hypothetical protein